MTVSIAIYKAPVKPERPALEKGQMRIVRRFEGGMVELEDHRGRRMRRQTIQCPRCSKLAWDDISRRLNPSWVCPECMTKSRLEREAKAEAYHRRRRQIMFENGETSPQRRAAIFFLASPKWRDRKAIKAVYDEAKRKTLETGIQHHVDHIYPLQGAIACGLHVHQNLRVIPASDNCSKGANFPLEQSPAWGDLKVEEIEIECHKMLRQFRHLLDKGR